MTIEHYHAFIFLEPFTNALLSFYLNNKRFYIVDYLVFHIFFVPINERIYQYQNIWNSKLKMLHFIVQNKYNFAICSITGGLSGDWLSWSVCSTSCGAGIQKRQRDCDSPPPYVGGGYRSGLPFESRSCNNMCCPSMWSFLMLYVYVCIMFYNKNKITTTFKCFTMFKV